ncbi:MAG: penicillin-binding protein 2, penicillin-binding protein 2 [Candidatus Adlerbacteria bacterium]|nr:penicillin-binding protein 2, penicillin-binding protein 2 [Candidatus Adlerbacteria bacterium]
MWGRSFGRSKKLHTEIDPDEIFIDSSNLPEFNKDQFEGRIERPINQRTLGAAAGVMALILLSLMVRAVNLQIVHGASYAQRAIDNQLAQTTIFADRGIITDRNGLILASNDRVSVTDDFAARIYSSYRGISHTVGYVKSPAKDSSGTYFRKEFDGMDGVEEVYNTKLAGQNGLKLTETDARGKVVSESTIQPPTAGEELHLSVDAKLTQGLYDVLVKTAQASGFQGGAGVMIDVQTGEIVAMASYPEYSSQAVTNGDKAAIAALNSSKNQPFLNRAIDGLYAPGSIVKPIMGIAVLTEGVISPDKQILSTGQISLPNPYDPAHPSIFKDWRANGWVNVRQAIAVSSDVYFYAVGGGYQDQKGIGIDNIDKYLQMFGYGVKTGIEGFTEPTGNIPTPAWKEANFDGDPWRIGDTYHTAIGQYGMQVTPLQAARSAAAVANNGKMLVPTLIASSTPKFTQLNLPANNFEIVREGMRMGVTEGIAQAVKFDFVHVAAKTGTAQIGTHNQFLNSWMIGFFPYEKPKYAYAIVLERGPAGTLIGASATVGQFFLWMRDNTPQYFAAQQ